MSEWQSIETAPKDGTLILLAARAGVTVQAAWEWDRADPTDGGYWDYWENVPEYGIHQFTHWMPLPEPPE